MSTDQIRTSLSRRSFLAGSSLLAAGSLASLAGCAPKSAESANPDEALAETGADTTSPWPGEPPVISDDEVVETIETDFLVIGAGTGGLFAACAAGEAGLETLVIDKTNGGVVRDDIGAVNSRLQQQSGYTIDKQAFMKDMYHYAAGQCNMALHHVWFERSGETVDWYENLLAEYGITLWHEHAEEKNEPNYPHWATGHSPAWPADGSLNGFEVLKDHAEKTGAVSFRFQTPMRSLIMEDDRVVGAWAEGEEGFIRINARKGTLVCTGGYGRNDKLMKQLQPHTTSIFSYNSAQPGCEGDGIRACLWAGAKMDETHSSMLFDRSSVAPDALGGIDNTEGQVFWMGSQPWLKVNLNGERFCNESGTYDYILHADASQPGNIHVCLWDADWMTYAEQFDMHGCSRLFEFDNGAPPNFTADIVAAMNDGLLEMGHIQQADTIEELAEKLGLPADALVETVNRNNENYDNGNDPDFGKEPFRLSPVRKPPFYGVRTTGAMLCTMDGIVVNTHGQALRADGTIIEGLYVTGNDSGAYYSMTYPNLATGHACGRTVTFARMIAQDIAAS
ncbi:FAD-dependent oxidoreductase [Adlercreutzia equolifaciens]|uniref:FAD-dependent oxidoreductase n=1 Tax=Adlercreutzia equolifaciens TaxID=446660 RepID=UPI001F4D88E2|nr:FAD-binding protein [Adlercreutzia equolifaciens]